MKGIFTGRAGFRLLLALCLAVAGTGSLFAGNHVDGAGPPLALNFVVTKGDAEPVSSQMLVSAGNDARMTLATKDGTTYRIDVIPRYAMDSEGAMTAHIQANLFEQQGGRWLLRTSPELVSPLSEAAGVEVGAPAAGGSAAVSFSVQMAAVDSSAVWLEATDAERQALVLPRRACKVCSDGQTMCCSNACCSVGGCGTICDGRQP